MRSYDALLLLSFGGPEGPDDVMPFLQNVVRGRGVPRERLLEVEAHYQRFGGISPISGQCRDLVAALGAVLDVPVYWGNRNWHPMVEDTVRRMRDDGITRAAVFATSAYGGFSSCRQYYQDIARATAAVEGAPELVKLRHFGDHPGFVTAMADHTRAALERLPEEVRDHARLVFTAHSVPLSAARSAGLRGGLYEQQLRQTASLVHAKLGRGDRWDLVWQSRSGPPEVPWLEPDVCDHLRKTDAKAVVLVPIGFVSDHMEVVYDLDTEAVAVAEELGLPMTRAATAGTHPRFVRMVRELMSEAAPMACQTTCCMPPSRPTP